METETISSRNAVQLMLEEVFNAGLCKTNGETHASNATAAQSDFILGWDC